MKNSKTARKAQKETLQESLHTLQTLNRLALSQPTTPHNEKEEAQPTEGPTVDPSSDVLLELIETNHSDDESRLKIVNDRSMAVSALDETKESIKPQNHGFFASLMGMFTRQTEENGNQLQNISEVDFSESVFIEKKSTFGSQDGRGSIDINALVDDSNISLRKKPESNSSRNVLDELESYWEQNDANRGVNKKGILAEHIMEHQAEQLKLKGKGSGAFCV